jgi:fluoride exporter
MVAVAHSVDSAGHEPLVRVAAIAGGGALGTLGRYGVSRALVPPVLGFPWDTFLVNVAGSFVLGVIVVLVVERWPPTRYVRPFVAIGFCGGFTTFSTMVVQAAQLGQHHRVGLAAVYLLASLAVGLVAAAAGMGAARGRLLPGAGERAIPDPDDVGPLLGRPAPADRSDDDGTAS